MYLIKFYAINQVLSLNIVDKNKIFGEADERNYLQSLAAVLKLLLRIVSANLQFIQESVIVLLLNKKNISK